MSDRVAFFRSLRFSDRTRLMAFSIAVLALVSIAAAAVTALQFQLAVQAGDATDLASDAWRRRAVLAAVETLALVIAGSTILVRVCNPFIRRLEESDARIRAIVCLAGDGIITIDQQGTIESFNRAAERMFKVSEASVVGRGIDRWIELPTSFSQAQLGPFDTAREYSNQRALGRRAGDEQFPLEFSLARVPLGERTVCTVIVRDTTEREAAQQQTHLQMCKLQEVKEILEAKAAELAETNRELDDFTYIASHDLKEPLRGISAYCQILLEDYGQRLDADGQRRLQALVGLCQRLSQLIDDLLTYSQIRRTEPDQLAADMNEVAADVLATLGPAIDERGAVVCVNERLPSVSGDPVWLGEVFRNLVTNAMKFNDSPSPRVEIGCLAGTTFYVRDNGIGIEPCHHEAIFAMFRRLHSRRKYEGTGAGLTFVRKIVEAHGGRVWVESNPTGGSTFYFTLSTEPNGVRQEPESCVVG